MGQALPLLLAALLAGTSGQRAATAGSTGTARAGAGTGAARARRPPRAMAAHPAPLEEARAALKALMADRTKRRLHHNWDRAISRLLAAGRGADAGPVQLEAARARYALYRWSADESDREKALQLASRAAKAGVPQATAFAAAIRREAGDDRPAARPRADPSRPTTLEPAADDEAVPDPELEGAVAALASPANTPGSVPTEAGTANVSAVRTWAGDDYTRVAVYMDRWIGWRWEELAATDGAPRRLVLDLKPAQLDGAAFSKPVPGERVDRVRTAQRDAETVRVVLDLPGRDAIAFHRLDDPPRLIVDVGTRAAAREARVAIGRERPPSAAPPGAPAEAEEGDERRLVRRVVVDAGHGGLDPGAIGPTRIREKDVTLAIARRLGAHLRKAGFEVVMTRDGDRYVALEERTAIANARRGDLFVSIHANAHPRRALNGTETWILNTADSRYARRLAARENGVEDAGEGGEAGRLLTNLDARLSTVASRQLAQEVQRELVGTTRQRFGDSLDLGVKSALFYVLVGARMPAVLVETAFISNRREEQRLASAAYQEDTAAAIARAVAHFARSDLRVARAEGAQP
jgi:N-acetylmuramoyl-L-alanine amidase